MHGGNEFAGQIRLYRDQLTRPVDRQDRRPFYAPHPRSVRGEMIRFMLPSYGVLEPLPATVLISLSQRIDYLIGNGGSPAKFLNALITPRMRVSMM